MTSSSNKRGVFPVTDEIFWEASNGGLRYVSPSCERITGYTPGEFMADPRLIDAIILPETERYLVQVLADSKISR